MQSNSQKNKFSRKKCQHWLFCSLSSLPSLVRMKKSGWDLAEYGWDLAQWLERLTANAEVATVLGLIQAASDTAESKGRQTKQSWIQYIEKKSKKIPLVKNKAKEPRTLSLRLLWWCLMSLLMASPTIVWISTSSGTGPVQRKVTKYWYTFINKMVRY